MSRVFNIKQKLSGIFGSESKAEAIAYHEKRARVADAVARLKSYPEWVAMQDILDSVRGDAVNKFRKGGLTQGDIEKANATIQAIERIESIMETALKQGEESHEALRRLEATRYERSDTRSTAG